MLDISKFLIVYESSLEEVKLTSSTYRLGCLVIAGGSSTAAASGTTASCFVCYTGALGVCDKSDLVSSLCETGRADPGELEW